MDPKVCGKLLTTHRRGYGVDVEALCGGCPLRRSSGTGPKMGSRGYRRLWRWNTFLAPILIVRGYVGIYRRKEYVGGAPKGPRGRGHAQGGALHPRGLLDCFLTCTPSPLDHVRSKNHAPEGFIPFGLLLIFLFFETLK